MNNRILIIFIVVFLFVSCNEETIISPEKTFSFSVINGQVGMISSVTLNSNGTIAAWSGNSNDVKVLGSPTFRGHIGMVNSVKLNKDGSLLLSGSNDHNIKLWETRSGTLLRTFSEHITITRDVIFTPDEKSVASAEGNYLVYWANAVSGFIGHLTMHGHTGIVSSVDMDPEMKMIISASRDSTIKIWSAETGNLIQSINAHNGPVLDVKINPVAKQFASCGDDSTIKIWDLNTFGLLKTLKKDMKKLNSISYHYSGAYVACGGDKNNIYLWDLKSDSVIVELEGHENSINAIEFSSAGDDLISGGLDEKVIIWRNVFLKK